MIILKVFNNNSVVALSDDRQDVIVTGAGVGFHKKPGDRIDEHRIEKRFQQRDLHCDQRSHFLCDEAQK